MPGVKGQRQGSPGRPFEKGNTIQPLPEQRATGILRARRREVAQSFRQELGNGVEPGDPVAWLYMAVDIAKDERDAKALLQAVELTWLYTIGKPREQLSEREGLDMIAVIEQAAREMSERTIDGEVTDNKEQDEHQQ